MNRDLQKRVIFGALALAVFIPLLVMGGVVFQLFIGSLKYFLLPVFNLNRCHIVLVKYREYIVRFSLN